MPLPDHTSPPEPVPLFIASQVEAFALVVRRQTCAELAEALRRDGQALAADFVEDDGAWTELTHSLSAIPKASTSGPEHGAGCRAFACQCGCDRAQDCQDCHRCACWRAQCCAHVAEDRVRREERTRALRQLLDTVDLTMLTELRETAAEAEEARLRSSIARRLRLLAPGDGRQYETAVFDAVDAKLCMGHADYSERDVALYAVGQEDPNEIVDLDDAVLSSALGALAELLRPEEGAQLTVDLDHELDEDRRTAEASSASSPKICLPFCAFCRRALVSPSSPGETEPYFDLEPGEEPPPCAPGHNHETVIWADVAEADAGCDLPLTENGHA
ncbi:hypothetical protein [Streptomyces sp. IBSBF 2950]|uniref:hypothetical protein n=1 Tax=Streptomyces sp. IBSBF 2950 TaxID=2903528 RepID=UPI002FDBCBE3